MKRAFCLSLLIVLLTSGCSARPVGGPASAPPIIPQSTMTFLPPEVAAPLPTPLSSTMAEAYDVLVNFLTLLHQGKYAQAVPLYGGEYGQLQIFNPQIDPNDRETLWSWACENKLLQCLELRSATWKNLAGDTYNFQVEFSNPDGSLFVLGPCCGATETEMPPVSQFEFTVSRNAEGKFVVMTMPPYVP